MGSILFWLLISLAALAADIITSSFFLSGFTIGGVAAMITQIFKFNFSSQMTVFIVVSILAVAGEYALLRTKLKKSIPKTLKMEEEYVGRYITLEEDLNLRGRVKIEGIYWTVENTGEPLLKGDKAEVISIKGNKLLVKREKSI